MTGAAAGQIVIAGGSSKSFAALAGVAAGVVGTLEPRIGSSVGGYGPMAGLCSGFVQSLTDAPLGAGYPARVEISSRPAQINTTRARSSNARRY